MAICKENALVRLLMDNFHVKRRKRNATYIDKHPKNYCRIAHVGLAYTFVRSSVTSIVNVIDEMMLTDEW
jgi:hypothetical protein